MLEGKTTVSITLTTDAFHELEHFPQETPEQPHPNTPFFLPGGPGNLFKLTIHWIFIYTKWKRATKVPGPAVPNPAVSQDLLGDASLDALSKQGSTLSW